MSAGRALIVVTFVLGLVALFATRCSAQQPAPPIEIHPQAQITDPRGNLGLEILGGSVGLAMGSVLTYGVLHSQHDCGGGHAPTLCDGGGLLVMTGVVLLAAPGLASAGVLLAGNDSGGNGKLGKTMLGAYLGGFGGAVLGGMLSRDASGQGDPRASLSIGALGLVSGAVLAYRSSSRATPMPALTASVMGRGLTLSLCGQI